MHRGNGASPLGSSQVQVVHGLNLTVIQGQYCPIFIAHDARTSCAMISVYSTSARGNDVAAAITLLRAGCTCVQLVWPHTMPKEEYERTCADILSICNMLAMRENGETFSTHCGEEDSKLTHHRGIVLERKEVKPPFR